MITFPSAFVASFLVLVTESYLCMRDLRLLEGRPSRSTATVLPMSFVDRLEEARLSGGGKSFAGRRQANTSRSWACGVCRRSGAFPEGRSRSQPLQHRRAVAFIIFQYRLRPPVGPTSIYLIDSHISAKVLRWSSRGRTGPATGAATDWAWMPLSGKRPAGS